MVCALRDEFALPFGRTRHFRGMLAPALAFLLSCGSSTPTDSAGGVSGASGNPGNTGGVSGASGGSGNVGGVSGAGEASGHVGGISGAGGNSGGGAPASGGGVGGTSGTSVSATGASGGGAAAGASGSSGASTVDASVGSAGSAATGGAIGTSGSAPDAGQGGLAGSSGDAGRPSGLLRIMPLGDSTTGSVCWRALLWQTLNQNGDQGKFQFVGSRTSDAGCTPANYDKTNEGHPGVLVTNFIKDADELTPGVQTLQSVLGPHPADVVLLHFATNDVWNGIDDTTILSAYTTVVGALRAANPKVIILAAQLIPMDPVATASCPTCACPACGARIQALNAAIPAWAMSTTTSASPVMVVDQWTGFDATPGVDTVDGVHPNATGGSPKIANNWYKALTPLF